MEESCLRICNTRAGKRPEQVTSPDSTELYINKFTRDSTMRTTAYKTQHLIDSLEIIWPAFSWSTVPLVLFSYRKSCGSRPGLSHTQSQVHSAWIDEPHLHWNHERGSLLWDHERYINGVLAIIVGFVPCCLLHKSKRKGPQLFELPHLLYRLRCSPLSYRHNQKHPLRRHTGTVK